MGENGAMVCIYSTCYFSNKFDKIISIASVPKCKMKMKKYETK